MTTATQFEATESGLTLTNAILLYRHEAPQRDDRYTPPQPNGPAFASIHGVEHDERGPTIAAGAPLSRAHLRQWAAALGSTQKPEILPESVLVSHPDMLVWWTPAKVRASYFALTRPPEGMRALAVRTVVNLPYPAHVFIVTRGRLGVYALATSDRPTADTVLLHSPVLNVYINGQLCWGNIAFPKTITPAAIPAFEAAVFDSWSTHPNPGQEATVTGRGGLVRMWDGLAARKTAQFPTRRLKPFSIKGDSKAAAQPITLGQMIKRSARA